MVILFCVQREKIDMKCEFPDCGGTHAWQDHYLLRAPRILVVQLKRFEYQFVDDDILLKKLHDPISIPNQIDLSTLSGLVSISLNIKLGN